MKGKYLYVFSTYILWLSETKYLERLNIAPSEKKLTNNFDKQILLVIGCDFEIKIN